ncbi:iron-sulfur cluster biosynthesis family protein [Bacillus sp. FJAT-42376]|uniref:iron-sulfur cluster biosynthesis family protein n=1 Tax=Bacillus sp. FJAT-42376 TaxID=2014076 RepID=UPI000F4DE002|nr:iron-sulfur cluster biosynthesis family protein [Bacillus sp. FJAT-42376]AZB44385.1 iron-sulfur cluster biosynthesis family protein [Bacillus sp. FJAT-42376]
MIKLTERAKQKLSESPEGTVFSIPFDPGSCDIVNNVYEIKGMKDRELEGREKKISAEGYDFIVDKDFEKGFDHELEIDFSNNHFVLRNKNQIFNSRVRLTVDQ